ncbi:MAG: hypothetical protein IPL46_31310 [Saprospiraceae bacterium]|nr:hypothetical protein [Saprospiraceae bacterium]
MLILILSFTSSLLGQQMSQGTVKFAVTDVQTTSTEMQQMIGSMKGMSQVIEFDGKHQRVTMDMMGGLMKIKTYWDATTNVTETYMDMMGQKIKTVMSGEDMDKLKAESADMMKGNEIKYDKNDRKKILGRDCYKATFESETNGQKFSMVLYVTEEIKVPNSFVQNLNQMQLVGTPLQWIMDAGMMKMTFEATEISKELAGDFFSKPEGEYKEMSMEQLQQMGMGGQLGF